MLFGDRLVVVRGGGDLATGAVFRLHRAGFPAVVLELAEPLTVRRTVAFSSAVDAGRVDVEGVTARRVDTIEAATRAARDGTVTVLVSPSLPGIGASVVVDARMAKHSADTTRRDAPLVLALGPGFTAGVDCDAVVETMRGPRLGRVIWNGAAAPNTGVPGTIGGRSAERVLRTDTGGRVSWEVEIGDLVQAGQGMGAVDGAPIVTSIDGVARGLIAPGREVEPGTKIGDVDPRGDRTACFEISDKALAVGGGVVEAVLTWLSREHDPR